MRKKDSADEARRIIIAEAIGRGIIEASKRKTLISKSENDTNTYLLKNDGDEFRIKADNNTLTYTALLACGIEKTYSENINTQSDRLLVKHSKEFLDFVANNSPNNQLNIDDVVLGCLKIFLEINTTEDERKNDYSAVFKLLNYRPA